MRYWILLLVAGCAASGPTLDERIAARKAQMSQADVAQACRASLLQMQTTCSPGRAAWDDSACDTARGLVAGFCY